MEEEDLTIISIHINYSIASMNGGGGMEAASNLLTPTTVIFWGDDWRRKTPSKPGASSTRNTLLNLRFKISNISHPAH